MPCDYCEAINDLVGDDLPTDHGIFDCPEAEKDFDRAAEAAYVDGRVF